MDQKKTYTFNISVILLAFALLLLLFVMATPVQARSFTQDVDNGTCTSCHEDLYFLHDTGNWFCIRESPMPCVACHGGDPTATTQESAHYDRSAHPIVNGDISRCQECHADEDECCECVSKFDQVAGLKEVKLSAPVAAPHASNQAPGLPVAEKHEPVNWLLLFEVLTIIVVLSLALTIYSAHVVRQS